MGAEFQSNMILPLPVALAIETLESSGYEAWCVGGCVRDNLLGRIVHDFDLASNATWQQAASAFTACGYAVHETGTRHGTITVVIDGMALEVTTFRTESGYTDGRHPDNVVFVSSIEEDLIRRDFTINAMAYHPRRGLLDPFGGHKDLSDHIIRCVGDPIERFREDALRILRACRFASQLGFTIDPDTLLPMQGMKLSLTRIASERITHELEAMLCGEHIHDALMQTFNVICGVLPELAGMKGFEQHTPYHIYDVLEHTAYVLQYTPPEPVLRWAALLHDSGKPGAFFMDGERGHFFGHSLLSVILARSVLARMCYSQSFVDDVLELVRIHDVQFKATPKSVKHALKNMGGRTDLFRSLCALKRADALAQAPICAPRVTLADELLSTLDSIIASESAFKVGDLAINGNDIMGLGVPSGPLIGDVLDAALEAVIDEEVPNEHDALLAFAQKRIG